MVAYDSSESSLLSLISDLRVREEEYEGKLEETRRQIEAIQLVLALLREKNGISATDGPERQSLVEQVRGMTHMKALTTIAQANNGKLRVAEAKRIFLQAGLKKNPKTAYQGITSTLIRSDRFERSAPGEYRLVSQRAFQ